MRVRRSVGAARPGSREARAARRLRRARARPLPSSRRQRGGRRERAAAENQAISLISLRETDACPGEAGQKRKPTDGGA